MPKRLLVIIPDRLGDLVKKGEITERYYNPGNVFDEILIVKTIEDNVDIKLVQKMAGKAHLQMVDLPMPTFTQSLGYQPWLLRHWVNRGIELARQYNPQLIRAHSNFSAGYLASKIKLDLNVPLIVSIHTQPDTDYRGLTKWWPDWKTRLVYERYKVFENLTNRTADWILPVYDSGMEYCKKHNVRRAVTCYNALNPTYILPKEDYELHSPIRILCVNRMIACKNPDMIIRAMKYVPNAELTIVGQGELADYEKQVAVESGVADRIHFIPSIPNDDLCQMYKDYDIYSSHVEAWGIGKSTIEALLVGLPVVLNLRESGAQPIEYTPDIIQLVPNTPEDFARAFNTLIANRAEREKLGRNARLIAEQKWSPQKAESHFVEIYQQALDEARTAETFSLTPSMQGMDAARNLRIFKSVDVKEKSKRLLVVIPDRLEDLVVKGEITERYYNPGNLFNEILLLKTIGDNVDPKLVQKMAGKAHLQMIDLPMPTFTQSLGYQPWLLEKWVKQGIDIATQFNPHLIRAHSNFSSGYLASKIKLALDVPLVVSLHTQPDVDLRMYTHWWPNWKNRLVYERYKVFENLTNQTADWFLPAYDSGMEYCKKHHIKRAITCYNVLNPTSIHPKQNYQLHSPVKILCVNRLIPWKNPDMIIRAMKLLPNAELTIVGQGELAEYEKQVALEAGVEDRIHFIPSIPNDDLCRMYKDFDIYSSHIEWWGIGKSTIEAFLTGLPVVLNQRDIGPDPVEYTPDIVWLVPNTAEAFAEAFTKLIENSSEREKLGRNARKNAEERWLPRKTENRFVEIYHRALQETYNVDLSEWQPDFRSLKEINAKEVI
ncbi:MAG: glycosyltransferase family 4 protein [Leptolinea sp.]|nr:glycosyltransferase family 4 protein [Leptolinea sp.]